MYKNDFKQKSKNISRAERNGLEIWCTNCGFHRPVNYTKIRKLRKNNEFICENCKMKIFQVQTGQPCAMRSIVPTLEKELRDFFLIGFVQKEIDVWDCQGEFGKSPDPIIINGIPMRIVTGDIPFYWKEKYYIIELKLAKLNCGKQGGQGIYTDRRELISLRSSQWKMLLSGVGILIIVVEPKPSQIGLIRIEGKTKEDCQELIENLYRQWIANDLIPYDVYILNGELFKEYWEKSLRDKQTRSRTVFGHDEYFKTVTLRDIDKLIPAAKVCVKYSELLNGKIIDVILGRL
ncbi:MAG: hypothetical protein HWN66_09575 [Candidatus Helarchaeota archaeon]|nr:hypothetical protein [Candidatus Helarchaeota archaeon]